VPVVVPVVMPVVVPVVEVIVAVVEVSEIVVVSQGGPVVPAHWSPPSAALTSPVLLLPFAQLNDRSVSRGENL
jgi:hypothetical protein